MNIQKIIDEDLLSKQKPREYSGKIGASSLGQCYRRTYWAIKREPPTNPPDTRTLRVFECGNLFHEYIQNKLTDYQLEQAYEDDVVSIRVDGVNEEEVLEIKSMHSRGFWRMDKELETKTIQEIKPQHVLQLMCGCKYFNKKIGRLVYVSKDDLCIKEFRLIVDIAQLKRVEEEIATIKRWIDGDTLPPAEPRLYGLNKKGYARECEYCNFKDKCTEVEKCQNGK